MSLAPIVLFVYARPDHTRKTIRALQASVLACQSDLFVFSDAAKSEKDRVAVAEVRALFDGIDGFRSVTIVARESNHGLAKNIVEGLDYVFKKYDQAIVLEDDIVVLPQFLDFMNKALQAYQYDARVWHVSGWNYPVDINIDMDSFFWRVMNCWGWATWADRWAHYSKDPARIVNNWSLGMRYRFNISNSYPFFSHIIGNYLGVNNTWAVFWYATIFEHEGLCLSPCRSLVENVGNDGSGTHHVALLQESQCWQEASTPALPDNVSESPDAIRAVEQYFRERTLPWQKMKNSLKVAMPSVIWKWIKNAG